jgi:hypothetical protein
MTRFTYVRYFVRRFALVIVEIEIARDQGKICVISGTNSTCGYMERAKLPAAAYTNDFRSFIPIEHR